MELMTDLLNAVDVEFLIENDGRFLPAGSFLPFQGMIGTDNQGNADGMRHTAEIRTRPLSDVRQIVADIGRAVNIFAQNVRPHAPDLVFLTGHFHHHNPIGGHVHFSSTAFREWKRAERGISILHRLATRFSQYYDDPAQINDRAARGYFVPDWSQSFRNKNSMFDIPNYHWEFRQWGSFLISPVYAYAAIALSKAVMVGMVEDGIVREPLIQLHREMGDGEPWDTDKVVAALVRLNLPNADLADLPQSLVLLEDTKREIADRWSADFVDTWVSE